MTEAPQRIQETFGNYVLKHLNWIPTSVWLSLIWNITFIVIYSNNISTFSLVFIVINAGMLMLGAYIAGIRSGYRDLGEAIASQAVEIVVNIEREKQNDNKSI